MIYYSQEKRRKTLKIRKANDIMKIFNYTNSYGYHKRLCVYAEENGKYPCVLWCMDNGELCGNGQLTREEINDLLSNYGLSFDN